MTPSVAEYISEEDSRLFKKIRALVEAMPDITFERNEEGEKIVLSCHILCQALVRIYPELRIEHGYFRTGLSHSWLVTKSGSIMDFYVPGAIGALILPQKRPGYLEVWYSMYEKNGLAEMFTVFSSWTFDRAVTQVEIALRSVRIPSLVL